MKALILAGGKGTRLRPLTVYTPKPIVPFLNQPFLLFQLKSLIKAGISDITLSLSYQPDKIEQILGDGSDYGVNLKFITEPSPMGTGGAFRYAAGNFRETTIVLNGDILTDVNLADIIEFHQQRKSEATIALTPVENPSLYGLVETESGGQVLKFREKPTKDEIPTLTTNYINAGIYILEPSILDIIPKGENASFEYKVFPEILERKMPFYAFTMKDNYWRDIGNPASYLAAHHDFLDGKIKGIDLERNTNFERATAASIDKKSIIGTDCIIKPNAQIINSVLGTGVHIEEKAVIENSVIWAHTRISNSAKIKDSIIGRSCYLGKNVEVSGGAVLGDKTSLTDYSKFLHQN